MDQNDLCSDIPDTVDWIEESKLFGYTNNEDREKILNTKNLKFGKKWAEIYPFVVWDNIPEYIKVCSGLEKKMMVCVFLSIVYD